MTGLDRTGLSGKGPMTGKVQGLCVLTHTEEDSRRVKGFVGLQGVRVDQKTGNVENTRKELIMPRGDGTGPGGQDPGTGRGMGRGQGRGRMGRSFAAGKGGR